MSYLLTICFNHSM